MLSAADAKVVRRDPRIPALPLLLDNDAFVETLAGLYPGTAITALEARYLRYKPGMSCLAGYRATTPAGTLEIYARAHNPAGMVEHQIRILAEGRTEARDRQG